MPVSASPLEPAAVEVDPVWHRLPDGTYTFEPSSDPQDGFLNSIAREILFSGMYGSGKSVAMVLKAWKLSEYYPRNAGVVLRRHYEDLKISTLRIFPKLMGTSAWRRGLIGGEKEPDGFIFPNGSTIDFLGVSGDEKRTQKLKSTEYGWGMADEVDELTENEWEMLLGRLRLKRVPFRQAFGGCNPNSPHHWLYQRFGIKNGPNRQWESIDCPACTRDERSRKRKPRADCKACGGRGRVRRLMRELFMSGAADNDQNQPAEYIAWRRGLTGMRGKRYRDGLWVMYEGNVFEQYDPAKHVCDPPAEWAEWGGFPPPDWPRVRGIDLGFDNPFVCQWWAISPDDHWFRYRELYVSLVTVPNLARQMRDLEAVELNALRMAAHEKRRLQELADYLERLNVRGSYCDHDRGERQQLWDAGFDTAPADKDITAGLDMLIDVMNPEQPGGTRLHLVRGAAVLEDERLKFDRLPICTEDEIPGYVWDKNTAGTLAGRKKGIPVDRDNHGIDAMRYAVYSHRRRPVVAVY